MKVSDTLDGFLGQHLERNVLVQQSPYHQTGYLQRYPCRLLQVLIEALYAGVSHKCIHSASGTGQQLPQHPLQGVSLNYAEKELQAALVSSSILLRLASYCFFVILGINSNFCAALNALPFSSFSFFLFHIRR